MNEPLNLNTGDRVLLQLAGQEAVWVTVEAWFEDVKNGHPGFDWTDTDGRGRWAYDRQVVEIEKRTT